MNQAWAIYPSFRNFRHHLSKSPNQINLCRDWVYLGCAVHLSGHICWICMDWRCWMIQTQVDVGGGKKAIIIYVPYRLLRSYHKIQQRLVRELEKKFRWILGSWPIPEHVWTLKKFLWCTASRCERTCSISWTYPKSATVSKVIRSRKNPWNNEIRIHTRECLA